MDETIFGLLQIEFNTLKALLGRLEAAHTPDTDPFLADTIHTEWLAAVERWKHVKDVLEMAKVSS